MNRFYLVWLLLLCSPVAWSNALEADSSVNFITPLNTTSTASPFLSSISTASAMSLPNLPEPASPDASLLPTQNGSLLLKGSFNGDRILIRQDFANANAKGAPLDIDIVSQKIPDTIVGWLVSSRPDKTETVMNLGWRLGGNQQLLFSAAQLRGMVDSDVDNKSSLNLSQYTSGLNYRYFLDRSWLTNLELSGYASQSQSLNPATDSQQHIAGNNLLGMRVGVEASPLPDAKLKIGIGSERLSYDSLSGTDPVQNLNTSIKWSQVLFPTVKYTASVEGNALERNLSTGVDFNLRNGQQLGVKVAHTQWNDGQVADNAVQLSYTVQFGKKFTPFQFKAPGAPWNSSLVPEVLQRPGYLPKSVLAKPDSSLN